MNRIHFLVVAALFVGFLSGCGSVTGRAAARATSRSVQELGNEQVQEDFAGFMRSPSVMKAWQDLGESAGRGIAIVVSDKAPKIVEELAAAEHSHHLLGALARTAAGEVVHEMSDGVDGKLGPMAARVIRRDIGPAMAGVIRQDIGPAITEGIDAKLDETLAGSARTVAREAVLGGHEGLVGLREQPDSLLGGAVRFGIGAMQLVILGLGILFGLLIGLLVQSRRNERRERARADEREATLMEVVRALRQEPAG